MGFTYPSSNTVVEKLELYQQIILLINSNGPISGVNNISKHHDDRRSLDLSRPTFVYLIPFILCRYSTFCYSFALVDNYVSVLLDKEWENIRIMQSIPNCCKYQILYFQDISVLININLIFQIDFTSFSIFTIFTMLECLHTNIFIGLL